VFLAYLSIIPGMAIFLVRMETGFVEYYDAFYNAVRSGGSLEIIEEHRNSMVETMRLGIFEIVKIQALACLAPFVLLNIALTKVSILLGPTFYGYGFALALLAVVLAGFVCLGRTMENLEYRTFMMQ
jgi:uncharacterized membrane protein